MNDASAALAAYGAGVVIGLVTIFLLRSRLEKLRNPKHVSKTERDPYFNRDYARPGREAKTSP